MTYLDDKGYVSQIQSFSVNDGEGIRTTIFLSGCPLRCKWCSNPETWSTQPKIAVFKEKCTCCGECIRVCPSNTVNKKNFLSNEERCTACGICIDNCPSGARKIMGSMMSVKAVMDRVKRDLIFFRESGGGVTFSGGEPTFQRDFLNALVNGFENIGIDMAIESSGYFKWKEVKNIFDKMQMVFIDIKHMDSDKHKELTGVRNEIILQNIENLVTIGKDVVIRVPLMKGINSDRENITKTTQFIKEKLPGGKIELLPYHHFGDYKYDILGISQYKNMFETPSKEDIDQLKDLINRFGVELVDYK